MARPAKSKILYLEIDEEVTSIVDRMKSLRNKSIMLVIPNRATLLQSIVNLKLLKKQAEKIGKDLSVVTTDKTGRNLASQVGLTVYASVDTDKTVDTGVFENSEINLGKKDEREPSQESSGLPKLDEMYNSTLSALEKSKQLRSKIGLDQEEIEEVPVEKTIEEVKENVTSTAPEESREYKAKKQVRYKNTRAKSEVTTLKMLSPNKKLLYLMFSFSLVILLIVGYFVLPNATIEVQPKLEPISYTTNVTMLDVTRYANVLKDGEALKMIGSYPVEIKELTLTQDVPATGKRSVGKRSQGTITVRNKVGRTWDFVKNTRFRSADGIIFRTTKAVRVLGNQEADVLVIADDIDENESPVGERGNLEPTEFTIPGLAGSSPQYVDGYSKTAFTGGTNEFENIVLKGDIEAAKEIIKEKLFEIAEEKIVERIEKENKDRGLNLKLFKTGKNDADIRKEVLNVTVDNSIVGKVMDSFNVYATVKLTGVAYDVNEVVEIMEKGLKDMVLDKFFIFNINMNI